MKPGHQVDVDDVERCREVRRTLELEHGGLDGLFDHFADLDRKRIKPARRPSGKGKKADRIAG